MSGLKLHERTMPVSKAKNEAELWLINWQERHGLTPAEVVGFHGECLSRISRYTVREERGVERGDEAPAERTSFRAEDGQDFPTEEEARRHSLARGFLPKSI